MPLVAGCIGKKLDLEKAKALATITGIHVNDPIRLKRGVIFMHPKTWIASGHVEAFNDPLIDNKDSKKRYRADVLIEEHIEKLNLKVQKEIVKAEKRFKIPVKIK